MANRLTNLDVAEVSLVRKPNKRAFDLISNLKRRKFNG